MVALPPQPEAPLLGKLLYWLLPVRRAVIFDNLRRVFGDATPAPEIRRLAQSHYAHLGRLAWEFLWFPWVSDARRATLARGEPRPARSSTRAREGRHRHHRPLRQLRGRHRGGARRASPSAGALLLRAATVQAALARRSRHAPIPARGVRRAAQARRAGGILDVLNAGDLVVFPFDQHASRKDGVLVDFFGHPAGTFRSVAVVALATGAPVVPASSWREPDGRHVLRFEPPLEPSEHADSNEAIRLNTRAYNAALERMILRHPEQWWWVHRRWKAWPARAGRETA